MTLLEPSLALTEQPPDIMEFILSDKFLGRRLYPRQATLLKVIFLQKELFTSYDYDVLGEWSRSFVLPNIDTWDTEKPYRYQGDWGIQPDILERIDILRAEGRRWFREVLAVMGRRGGKGYIGALAGAYVMWHYICKFDPQAFYSIDRDKRLAALIFAGKKEQAKQNQWRDLVNVVIGAPCFQPYVSQSLGESLTVHSKVSINRGGTLESQGIKTSMDLASFEILPKEATTMGGRGPASFLIYFDEMAHVVATGASRGADELYTSSTPSLDQFGMDGFIYAGSSPWQMIGQFYDLCQQALEVELATLEPVHPEKLIIQLASWDIYKDWDRADKILRVPKEARHFIMDVGADRAFNFHYTCDLRQDDDQIVRVWRPNAFNIIERPIQVYDDQMRRLERANPETFRVERRSKWAAVVDTYLNPVLVERMFEPWRDVNLIMQTKGILNRIYFAHGDPSKSGANFGWAIAHTEGPDDSGLKHVVFDKIHYWAPHQFEDGQIDYLQIAEEVFVDLKSFLPEMVTFDQFNSAMIMQQLRLKVNQQKLPRRIQIEERTATRPYNWAVAETFKTALGLDLIHAPYFEQAELECKFLQDKGGAVDHPTTGPVQTKDVFDAMSNVVYGLIGDQMQAFLSESLRNIGIVGAAQHLNGPNMYEVDDPSSAARAQLSRFGQTYNQVTRGAVPRGTRGMR